MNTAHPILLKFLAVILLSLATIAMAEEGEAEEATAEESTEAPAEVAPASEDAEAEADDGPAEVTGDDDAGEEAADAAEATEEGDDGGEAAEAPEVVEEEVDISTLLDLPEEEETATEGPGRIDDDLEGLGADDQSPAGPSDRPSARGVGGKPKDEAPAQAIETESVDESQAEAEAERQRLIQEKEAELAAQQRELERRQRIERGLDEQIQDLKAEALLLGEELRLLSEKLIHPSSTQVTIFLSLKESDEDYLLDSVELKMNGRLVGSHLYTLREIDALRKGGVQRIFDGNLRAGDHFLELTVNGREDEETGSLNWRYDFTKGANPHFVELQVFQDRIAAKSW